jgi:hypothetical protein
MTFPFAMRATPFVLFTYFDAGARICFLQEKL